VCVCVCCYHLMVNKDVYIYVTMSEWCIVIRWWRFFVVKCQWKNAQRRRKHCTLAVVRRSQKFSPRRRPLPGGAGRPKFNQQEIVTTFTYRSIQFGEDRCTQFRVIVITDPQTNKHTNRQGRLQYTAPLSLARSVISLTSYHHHHLHHIFVYLTLSKRKVLQ